MKVSEVNDALRSWPERTKSLWPQIAGKGFWLRARPGKSKSDTPCPLLKSPGASLFTTESDGLYVYFNGYDFVDVICIEICNKDTNLHDKRSRYMPSTQSLLLQIPKSWLRRDCALPNHGKTPRWQACKSLPVPPPPDKEKPNEPKKPHLFIPVRFLRVLYALPDDLFSNWEANHIPAGHEFFCKQGFLNSYTGKPMQNFLKRMRSSQHFA